MAKEKDYRKRKKTTTKSKQENTIHYRQKEKIGSKTKQSTRKRKRLRQNTYEKLPQEHTVTENQNKYSEYV